MTNYTDLGLTPLINAYATVTKYGGSLMPPEVLDCHERGGERLRRSGRISSAESASASPS